MQQPRRPKARLGSGKREMPLDVRGRQTGRVLLRRNEACSAAGKWPSFGNGMGIGLGIEGEIRSSRGSMQALMQCNETSNPTTPAGRGRVKNNLDRSPMAASRVRY